MSIWKFDENAGKFRWVRADDAAADPDGFYVYSRLDGMTVRDGTAEPAPYPSDGRLIVAGIEFGACDFPCWERFAKIAGYMPSPGN
jgi:hypothetical protein